MYAEPGPVSTEPPSLDTTRWQLHLVLGIEINPSVRIGKVLGQPLLRSLQPLSASPCRSGNDILKDSGAVGEGGNLAFHWHNKPSRQSMPNVVGG